MIHKIRLTNYAACLSAGGSDLQLGTQDSYGTEQLQLALSPEWKGLAVTATFYAPGVSEGTRVLADAAGLIDVPPEATTGSWTIQPGRIVFAGTADGVQRISYDLPYTVACHSEVEGEESKATPTILAQAIAQIGLVRDEALSAASEAEQSAAEAAEYADAAETARAAAQAASEHADRIAKVLEDSEASVEAAKAEAIAQISAAKTSSVKAVSDAQAIGVRAVQNAQSTAESSMVEKQESAAASIQNLLSDSLQTIQDTASDAVASVTAEGGTQAERLNEIISNVYTKSESDARFAPVSVAICSTGSGNPAVCKNSVASALQGLAIYGKSTQDGTPSLEHPVPIVNTGDSGSLTLNITDGASQSQTLIIPISKGLPGIPVSSGGNYTNDKQERFACDYIDYREKKRVQWLASYTITSDTEMTIEATTTNKTTIMVNIPASNFPGATPTNMSTIGANCGILSNMLAINPDDIYNSNQISVGYTKSANFLRIRIPISAGSSIEDVKRYLFSLPEPVQILYVLATPISIPLSDQDMANYGSLHTYNGTTILHTDEPVAGMDGIYVIDGNAYRLSIESRLAALENAQA